MRLPVQRFVFDFPDDRPVIKYDDCGFYRKLGLEGTKAVDVLAIKNNMLFIIEASDLTGHRIENRRHVTKGGLAVETAQKVRDTIAVLYGAHRNDDRNLKDFSDFLYATANKPEITVVLLLEEDRPPAPHKSFEKIRSDLLLNIKQKLKYLHVKCMLHKCHDVPAHYEWTVRKQRVEENEA
jgi:hypothetical protein